MDAFEPRDVEELEAEACPPVDECEAEALSPVKTRMCRFGMGAAPEGTDA